MKRLLVALAACSAPATPATPHVVETAMLAPLPKPVPVDTPKFTSVAPCARCHAAGDKAMRDGQGADISPVTDAQASVMALAARDPYYLAAFRRELLAVPAGAQAIATICVRCHAPVGFAEDGRLSLDDLEAGTPPAAALGREGTGCAGCHALVPDGLGTDATFTGGAVLRVDRVSFGALPEPLSEAMTTMVRTKPVPSPHVSQSRLCASCHTVLVHALDASGAPVGDELPEQTTYLEWRNSIYQDETPGAQAPRTCQGCHLPAANVPTPFSTRPPDAPARDGFVRHTLLGGNAYLLERLAKNADWLNAAATAAQLAEAADRTRANLRTAAALEVAATGHVVKASVVNRTGHKLPTGYPTRRMWLHVVATDATGRRVFESGAHKAGAIVDGQGRRLDAAGAILPHVDAIDRDDQVAVWEAVPVDASGARTHLLLGAARFAKDDRILPAGWTATHADAARTKPIGVAGDATFVAGRDTVAITVPAAAADVAVELLYQSIPPETIESYKPADSREAARFRAIFAEPPQPIVMASQRLRLR